VQPAAAADGKEPNQMMMIMKRKNRVIPLIASFLSYSTPDFLPDAATAVPLPAPPPPAPVMRNKKKESSNKNSSRPQAESKLLSSSNNRVAPMEVDTEDQGELIETGTVFRQPTASAGDNTAQ
jgi:hypothetical protein